MGTGLQRLARHIAGMAARVASSAKLPFNRCSLNAPTPRDAAILGSPEHDDTDLVRILAASTSIDESVDMTGMGKEALRSWWQGY